MYLDKYLDYLSFEKKYSVNTLESYKNDVQGFLTFLKKNGTPINNDLNGFYVGPKIIELDNVNNTDTGNLIVMSDVSGSMSGDPMLVSIGMGILISEICHPAFRDLVLTFSDNPMFHDLSNCSTFCEKVETEIKKIIILIKYFM